MTDRRETDRAGVGHLVAGRADGGAGTAPPGGAGGGGAGTGEGDWSLPEIVLDHTPPEVDTSKPSIARVYDACLGGRDNYAVDREVVEEMRRISPMALKSGPVNREFLIRGVRYLAERGIDQFLDLGSGLPSAQNTHEAAQRVNPRARVVYVDNDPIVVTHGQALLARDARTRFVSADVLDVEEVLGHPVVEELLDFSRPIGLVMVAIVHHVLDEEDPAGLIRSYLDGCAPGSYLFLSHFADSFPEARELTQVLKGSLGRGEARSEAEIRSFFAGLELLEPGVVPLPAWRPDEPLTELLDHGGLLTYGGMARKP